MNALEAQAKAARLIRARRRAVSAVVVAMAEVDSHNAEIEAVLEDLAPAALEECHAELDRQDESLLDAVCGPDGLA
jgi:hypothetical protein